MTSDLVGTISGDDAVDSSSELGLCEYMKAWTTARARLGFYFAVELRFGVCIDAGLAP